jgi:hypothetical protein
VPDGDVFSRRIPRPWSDVSRRVFAAGEDSVVVPAAIKVLVRELRQVEADTLDTLVEVVLAAEWLPIDERWTALEPELRKLRLENDGGFFCALVQGFERAALKGSDGQPEPLPDSVSILVEALANVIDGCIYSSPALAHGVSREGVTSEMIRDRRIAVGIALRESEMLLKLAKQLEQTKVPGRSTLRAPRRPRLPQEEIIGIALC